MIKTKSEYETIVIKMLNVIISGQSLDSSLFPEYDDRDFNEILFQCVDDQLVAGCTFSGRTMDGMPHIDNADNLYVTFKGLSYIDSVNQAHALEIANLAKVQAEEAEKSSISAILKSNKAFILSIISILTTLLINADKIVHNLQKILSHLGLQ